MAEVYAESFAADDAGELTILFCDICDFDTMINQCGERIVSILDELFRKFDRICKKHFVQKIEAGSGSADRRQDLHVLRRTQVHLGA